jgi:type II secretory pathway pseudopilin PulG
MLRSRSSRRGFTMVEATLSIALTAIAGSAILLGVTSSIDATNDVVNQTIASGMAQQLLDEVLGTTYAAPGAGAHQTDLGPNTYETGGVARERYNDVDDFINISKQPPADRWGIALGVDNGVGGTRNSNFCVTSGYFSHWKQTIEVYYVSATNFSQKLTGTQTSDYRAVDVKIMYNDPVRGWIQLAQARRIVTYLQVP